MGGWGGGGGSGAYKLIIVNGNHHKNYRIEIPKLKTVQEMLCMLAFNNLCAPKAAVRH